MSKAFTRETEADNDFAEEEASNSLSSLPSLPAGSKNYITPDGHQRLLDEFQWLMNKERPQVTATVAWAAANGDRSENADYIYGKKRLREIDRRIRFLTRRLDIAEVVDPAARRDDEERIFFGATVTFANRKGEEKTISIVGVDDGIHLPLPDQPAVEAELGGAVGSWAGAMQRSAEWRGDGHACTSGRCDVAP